MSFVIRYSRHPDGNPFLFVFVTIATIVHFYHMQQNLALFLCFSFLLSILLDCSFVHNANL